MNDPVGLIKRLLASSVEQALRCGLSGLLDSLDGALLSADPGLLSGLGFALADNFAQGAKAAGLKQILYVGGLMPDDEREEASKRLSGRYEVEQVLQASSAGHFTALWSDRQEALLCGF